LNLFQPGEFNLAKNRCKNDFAQIKKICHKTAKVVLKNKNPENPPDPTDVCMDQGWCSTRSPTKAPTDAPVSAPTSPSHSPSIAPADTPVAVPTSPSGSPTTNPCPACIEFLSEFHDDFNAGNFNTAKKACKKRDNNKVCKNVIKDVKKEVPETQACIDNRWC